MSLHYLHCQSEKTALLHPQFALVGYLYTCKSNSKVRNQIHIVNADVRIDVYGCMVPAGILNNFFDTFYFLGVTVSVSDEFKYHGSTESTKSPQN